MTFNAARQSFFFSALVTGFLSVLFAVRYFLSPYPMDMAVSFRMPLSVILSDFTLRHPWTAGACVAVIFLWIIFILIQLTVRFASAGSRNYLPMQFFMITGCGLIIPSDALASYAAALLLILPTRQFIFCFRKDYRFEESFRAGFYMGVLPLLYAPATLLLLSIPAVMSIYRRSTRELIVSLTGALLPVAGAGFIYWAKGESTAYIYRTIWRGMVGCVGLPSFGEMSPVGIASAGLVLLLVILAFSVFLTNRKGMRTKQRKVMTHISLLFAFLTVSAAMPGTSASVLPLLAIPMALSAPFAFSGKSSVPATSIYCCIIVAVLTLNITSIIRIFLP